jgi:hypothetical protein
MILNLPLKIHPKHAKTKSQGLASQLGSVVKAKVLKGSNWISHSNKPNDRSKTSRTLSYS